MHDSVMTYVEWVVDNYRLRDRDTLEVGSYNVNGSVRPLFTGKYFGVDIRQGPGVDAVIDPSKPYPWQDETFGCVVSTEMLEHDLRPYRSVGEMERVLWPDGYLILTLRGFDARGAFPLHDYPGDHYRVSGKAVEAWIEDADLEVLDCRADPEAPGVFALAFKP